MRAQQWRRPGIPGNLGGFTKERVVVVLSLPALQILLAGTIFA